MKKQKMKKKKMVWIWRRS